LLGEFLFRTAEEFVEAGGGDGDAGAQLRLGEFLISHHVEDAWLACSRTCKKITCGVRYVRYFIKSVLFSKITCKL